MTLIRPDRRTALALLAAAAALPACRAGRAGPHIGIVGAGIIGATLAYRLSRSGARVTLLDRGDVCGRASRGTFAWINASWAKQPQHYHGLNQQGAAGWRALQQELDLPIRWQGSLEWFAGEDRQARLRTDIEEQIKWGEPARMIDAAEVARIAPALDLAALDHDDVALSAGDGAMDPLRAAQALVRGAVANGAALRTQETALSAAASGDGVRLMAERGPVSFDKLVIATGADPDAPVALGGLAIPQRSTPGVIVITRPMPVVLDPIIVAPGVHIHQRADGRVVLGEQDGAPDNDAHRQRLRGRPTRFPDDASAAMHADRIIAAAATVVPAFAEAQAEEVLIGWRPLPLDGHPVLGPPPGRPNTYFALAHSGVTLAPAIAELAATELLGDTLSPELAAYRPDRTFARIKRY